MNDDEMSEAIEFSLTFRNPCDEESYGSFSVWSDGLFDRAAKLRTLATGSFRALKKKTLVYPGNGKQVTELRSADSASIFSVFANGLWRKVDGLENPQRASEIVAAARVEYSRACLHSLLFWHGYLDRAELRPRTPIARSDLRHEIVSRNWVSADAISRNPYTLAFVDESAGDVFDDWMSRARWEDGNGARRECFSLFQEREPTREIVPLPTDVEMYAALALTWLDEALANRTASSQLLAEASCLLMDAGFIRGWHGARDELTKEHRDFSKRGTDALHARNREYKEKAIAAYKAGNFKSKDQAAAMISRDVVPLSFRVVRDYLKGL